MPHYRLYYMTGDRFAGLDAFDSEDDVHAVRHAAKLSGTGLAELWSGSRKVKVFGPRHSRSDAEHERVHG